MREERNSICQLAQQHEDKSFFSLHQNQKNRIPIESSPLHVSVVYQIRLCVSFRSDEEKVAKVPKSKSYVRGKPPFCTFI